ncbi:hypothetical protein FQN54_007788 [Arachnomyces sp. PD_36]|nr:hypothetical protein FQN54_007788 [Arachnomyces sp. PD_36]
MAARAFIPQLRTASSRLAVPSRALSRPQAFSTSSRMATTATAEALPLRQPVGAFRGGVFGFLTGSVAAGAAVYYYILDEYRLSNEMLTEDIYALQAATQRIHAYVTELEAKVDQLQKKK